MDYPRVSIIILNWNGWRDTVECLESLYRITYPNYDVIVVDNGSQDDSIQRIKEYAEGKIRVDSKFFGYNPANKPIRVFEIEEDDARRGRFKRPLYEKFDVDRRMILIKNKDNYGFAGGNNVGIKFALIVLNPEYVLLLNNDTIVDKHFLSELVKVAASCKNIGIVGPKIYYYDYDGKNNVINFAGARMITWKGKEKRCGFKEVDIGQCDQIRSVDKIHGACMLINLKLPNNCIFFDERFFAYWEETDLCYRVLNEGYKLVYVPTSKIWHKIARSSGGETSEFRIHLMTRNMFLFMKKHAPVKIWLMFFGYLLFWEVWFNTFKFSLYYKNIRNLMAYYKGIIEGFA